MTGYGEPDLVQQSLHRKLKRVRNGKETRDERWRRWRRHWHRGEGAAAAADRWASRYSCALGRVESRDTGQRQSRRWWCSVWWSWDCGPGGWWPSVCATPPPGSPSAAARPVPARPPAPPASLLWQGPGTFVSSLWCLEISSAKNKSPFQKELVRFFFANFLLFVRNVSLVARLSVTIIF